MKRTESLYRIAALVLLLMLAAACTRDDTFDDAAPGNGIDPAAVLTITVTDGAYTSAPSTDTPETSAANAATDDGAPVTRAAENGFATEFTKGDKIGLYVMDAPMNSNGAPANDKQMLHENLCLTYDGTAWKLPPGEKLTYTAPETGRNIFYFAYYPYLSNLRTPNGLNADGTATATTAPEFFHALIRTWNPQGDQSTYAAYTASDLMVAQGNVASNSFTLTFIMQHQMALAVIRLPHTVCTYTESIGGTDIHKSYDLYTGGSKGVHGCWFENRYTARCLVQPWLTTTSPDNYYYDPDFKKHSFTWETPRDAIGAGLYRLYTVDGGTETTNTDRGAPKEGDFYMKDGTVLPQEAFGDGKLPDDVKDDCIGVVFWVGEKEKYHWTKSEKTQGDRLLMYDHPECTHGMVVALKDATDGAQWGPNIEDNESLGDWANDFGEFTNDEQSKWDNIISISGIYYGYSRSAIIDLYTTHNADNDFPAYQAVKTYANANSTPEESSGWFFPGKYELATIVFGTPKEIGGKTTDHWKNINSQIEKTNGDKMTGIYWSNSDYNENIAWRADPEKQSGVSYGQEPKSKSYKVRAVLAF